MTGDLRYCITQANLGGTNTIQFDPTVFATAQTITGRNAGYAHGGGLANFGTLTMTNCTVTANYVGRFSGPGGGLYNEGTLTTSNCTVRGNPFRATPVDAPQASLLLLRLIF